MKLFHILILASMVFGRCFANEKNIEYQTLENGGQLSLLIEEKVDFVVKISSSESNLFESTIQNNHKLYNFYDQQFQKFQFNQADSINHLESLENLASKKLEFIHYFRDQNLILILRYNPLIETYTCDIVDQNASLERIHNVLKCSGDIFSDHNYRHKGYKPTLGIVYYIPVAIEIMDSRTKLLMFLAPESNARFLLEKANQNDSTQLLVMMNKELPLEIDIISDGIITDTIRNFDQSFSRKEYLFMGKNKELTIKGRYKIKDVQYSFRVEMNNIKDQFIFYSSSDNWSEL